MNWFSAFLLLCLPTPTPLTEHKVEQRSVLKFLSKTEGATPISCWRQMKQVFGDICMSQTRVQVWFKRFKDGRVSPKDDHHPGRNKTTGSQANVNRVHCALAHDRRKTVRMLASELDLPKTGVHRILKKNLKMSKIAPKLIPKQLTPEQEGCRRTISCSNLDLVSEDTSILSWIVTGDESWISLQEIDTKQTSCEWLLKGSPGLRPMKVRKQRSVRKLMLTVFWDIEGPILVDFLPPRTCVDSDHYLEVLGRLKENIRCKRPHLWAKDPAATNPKQRKFISHASSHTSSITLAFFLDIPLLAHPPYSPDLAPSDYFLFPHLKSGLAARQMRNLEDLKACVHRELRAIPKEDYRAAIDQWPVRWMKCIEANGSYFEGRHFLVNPDQYGLSFECPDDETSSEEESPNDPTSDSDS